MADIKAKVYTALSSGLVAAPFSVAPSQPDNCRYLVQGVLQVRQTTPELCLLAHEYWCVCVYDVVNV